ncbi:nitroreductase family deazaflavin-dependent oxidoreductase [Streptomyces sp. N2-109]|uniref:Nitroreductase family deazaflavin-dependent oxidoreductase n=1 Tax=Streptomyces gossypii TaxID=2883101 RepID=A0ABT2K3H1_9ACTN|nr:nitroreductase family deazaflavin-dependent oxidoreductase [Streptomyces gossypii]MCT2594712.1 nitroreductase family deazaflavin-dependent oxidoreductase [Streptomyces gossypii]
MNPVMRPVARRLPPFAVVEHTGRRSGKAYRNPVQAYRTDRGWVIALVYGKDADWVRNVLAAGGGQLIRRGRHHRLTEPRRLHGSAGRRLLPRWSRAAMGLARVQDYIEVTSVEAPGE